MINAAISNIVNGSKKDHQTAQADTPPKLSEEGKKVNLLHLALLISIVADFHLTSIPDIVKLLKVKDQEVQEMAADALSKFSEYGK